MECNDTALYRHFLGDGGDWGAVYEDFALTAVLLRERRAADPERPEDGVTPTSIVPIGMRLAYLLSLQIVGRAASMRRS